MSQNDKATLVSEDKPEDYGAADEVNPEQTYTVQEALDHAGCGVGNFIAIGGGFGANFAEGVESQVLAIIIPKLRCEWNLDDIMLISIPITYIIAKGIGGLIAARFIDHFGRIKMLIIGQFVFAIFAFLSAFSQNVWQLMILRAIVGVGMEFSTCTAPVYTIEFSPKSARAMLECGQFLSGDLGNFSITLLCFILLEAAGWRTILILASIPAFIVAIILLFQYETPYYSIGIGNVEEAQVALDLVYKYNKTEKLPGQLVKHDLIEDPKTFKLADYFDNYDKIKQTIYFLIIIGAMKYIQYGMSFSNPRQLNEGYCHTPLAKSKIAASKCHSYSDRALLSLTIVTLVQSVGNIAFYLASDIFGRLRTIRFGSIVIVLASASMLMCGGRIKLLVEIGIIRFVVVGMFVALLIYMNEYYPTHVRGTANGTFYAIGRFSAILGVVLALTLTMKTMWIFVLVMLVLACVMTLCTFLLNTETRDITII